jgi:hypothetical protein
VDVIFGLDAKEDSPETLRLMQDLDAEMSELAKNGLVVQLPSTGVKQKCTFEFFTKGDLAFLHKINRLGGVLLHVFFTVV